MLRYTIMKSAPRKQLLKCLIRRKNAMKIKLVYVITTLFFGAAHGMQNYYYNNNYQAPVPYRPCIIVGYPAPQQPYQTQPGVYQTQYQYQAPYPLTYPVSTTNQNQEISLYNRFSRFILQPGEIEDEATQASLCFTQYCTPLQAIEILYKYKDPQLNETLIHTAIRMLHIATADALLEAAGIYKARLCLDLNNHNESLLAVSFGSLKSCLDTQRYDKIDALCGFISKHLLAYEKQTPYWDFLNNFFIENFSENAQIYAHLGHHFPVYRSYQQAYQQPSANTNSTPQQRKKLVLKPTPTPAATTAPVIQQTPEPVLVPSISPLQTKENSDEIQKIIPTLESLKIDTSDPEELTTKTPSPTNHNTQAISPEKIHQEQADQQHLVQDLTPSSEQNQDAAKEQVSATRTKRINFFLNLFKNQSNNTLLHTLFKKNNPNDLDAAITAMNSLAPEDFSMVFQTVMQPFFEREGLSAEAFVSSLEGKVAASELTSFTAKIAQLNLGAAAAHQTPSPKETTSTSLLKRMLKIPSSEQQTTAQKQESLDSKQDFAEVINAATPPVNSSKQQPHVNAKQSTSQVAQVSAPQNSNPNCLFGDQIIELLKDSTQNNEAALKRFLKKKSKSINSWKSSTKNMTPRLFALESGQIGCAKILDDAMKHQQPSTHELNVLLNWAEQHSTKDSPAFNQAQELWSNWGLRSTLNASDQEKSITTGLSAAAPQPAKKTPKNNRAALERIHEIFTHDRLEELKKIEHKHFTFTIPAEICFGNNDPKYSYYGALIRSLYTQGALPTKIINYLIATMTSAKIDLYLPIPAPGFAINEKLLIDLAIESKNDYVIGLFLSHLFVNNDTEMWLKVISSITNNNTYHYTRTIENLIRFKDAYDIDADTTLVNLCTMLPPTAAVEIIFNSDNAAGKILLLLEKGSIPIEYFNNTSTLAITQRLAGTAISQQNTDLYAYLLCNASKEKWLETGLLSEEEYNIKVNLLRTQLAALEKAPRKITQTIELGPTSINPCYPYYNELISLINNNNIPGALAYIDTMFTQEIDLSLPINVRINGMEKSITTLYDLARHFDQHAVSEKIGIFNMTTALANGNFDWLIAEWQKNIPSGSENFDPTRLKLFFNVQGLISTLIEKMPLEQFFEGCRFQHGGYTSLLTMLTDNSFPIDFFTEERNINTLLDTDLGALTDMFGYEKLLHLLITHECLNDYSKQRLYSKLQSCLTQGQMRAGLIKSLLTSYKIMPNLAQELKLLLSGYIAVQDFHGLVTVWDYAVGRPENVIFIKEIAKYDDIIALYAQVLEPNYLIPGLATAGREGKKALTKLIETNKLDVRRLNQNSMDTLIKLGILKSQKKT